MFPVNVMEKCSKMYKIKIMRHHKRDEEFFGAWVKYLV